MKRILVTGSRGYIGSVLCPVLSDYGHEIVEFDKVIGNDLLSVEDVRDAVYGVDLIVHLAAIVGMAACDRDKVLADRVNITGTMNLVGSCDKPVVS